MTEEEMKTTHCCGPEGAGWLVPNSSPPVRYCLGSKCAGWRWIEVMMRDVSFNHTQQGYCGLAGKP